MDKPGDDPADLGAGTVPAVSTSEDRNTGSELTENDQMKESISDPMIKSEISEPDERSPDSKSGYDQTEDMDVSKSVVDDMPKIVFSKPIKKGPKKPILKFKAEKPDFSSQQIASLDSDEPDFTDNHTNVGQRPAMGPSLEECSKTVLPPPTLDGIVVSPKRDVSPGLTKDSANPAGDVEPGFDEDEVKAHILANSYGPEIPPDLSDDEGVFLVFTLVYFNCSHCCLFFRRNVAYSREIEVYLILGSSINVFGISQLPTII